MLNLGNILELLTFSGDVLRLCSLEGYYFDSESAIPGMFSLKSSQLR